MLKQARALTGSKPPLPDNSKNNMSMQVMAPKFGKLGTIVEAPYQVDISSIASSQALDTPVKENREPNEINMEDSQMIISNVIDDIGDTGRNIEDVTDYQYGNFEMMQETNDLNASTFADLAME